MQHLRAWVRFWWIVALCAAVGVALSVGIGSAVPKEYTSSISVLITGTAAAQPASLDAYQVTLLAQQRMATYSDVATSPRLASKVLKGLDTGLTPTQLAARTTAVVRQNSTVMRLSIVDTDAARARKLVSRAGAALVKLVDQLETEQAQTVTMLQALVVTEASPPSVSGSTAWRSPLLGGLVGLLLGLLLAASAARRLPRVGDAASVSTASGAPVLAVVPAAEAGAHLGRTTTRTTYDEAVHELRTAIFFLRQDPTCCLTVALTSPRTLPGLGPLVGRVAEALAETGARVLLVDAAGGVDEGRGAGPHGELSRVDVVRAGPPSDGGADWFHSDDFLALLHEAAEKYDYVLVDAPATSQGTDAEAVAARCQVTVLAVARGTRESHLREGLRRLSSVDARLRGVVLLS